MVERQAAAVLVDEGEGGTGGGLGRAQPVGQALNQHRLADPQRPLQTEHVAGPRRLSERDAQGAGLIGAGGDQRTSGEGVAGWR